jgi:predicted transglutaminase-like cysteine proteinase
MGTLGTKVVVAALAAPIIGWAWAAAASPAFMNTGGRTSQPVGHYELCRQLPQECRQVTPRNGAVELTRELWKALVDINNTVNMTIEPITDSELWGVEEYWSYPVNNLGDCEDYVLEKRRQLIGLGVPPGNLLITVVRQANGDGHAVLTVRTHMGDFVLDNLEPRILAWHDTEYQFLKRQSDTDSGAWVSINDGRAVAVGSVR